jgi:hypothetical protein
VKKIIYALNFVSILFVVSCGGSAVSGDNSPLPKSDSSEIKDLYDQCGLQEGQEGQILKAGTPRYCQYLVDLK